LRPLTYIVKKRIRENASSFREIHRAGFQPCRFTPQRRSRRQLNTTMAQTVWGRDLFSGTRRDAIKTIPRLKRDVEHNACVRETHR